MVTDTLLIGRVADLSVYVCRADYTHKAEYTLINELSHEQKLPNLCTIINGVDLKKRKYGYYYGYGKYSKHYGYGKRYGYGYAAGKEAPMDITLIGIGPGDWLSLTQAAARALEQALVILGAPRLLEGLPARCGGRRIACLRTSEPAACHGGRMAGARAGRRRPSAGHLGLPTGPPARCGPLQSPRPQPASPCCPGFPARRCWPPVWAAPGRTGSW